MWEEINYSLAVRRVTNAPPCLTLIKGCGQSYLTNVKVVPTLCTFSQQLFTVGG